MAGSFVIYAAGGSSAGSVRKYDGDSWTGWSIPSTTINAIGGYGEDEIWVGDAIYWSTWVQSINVFHLEDGSWVQHTIYFDTSLNDGWRRGPSVQDIHVVAPDDVYFVGRAGGGDASMCAWCYHWNGVSFTKIADLYQNNEFFRLSYVSDTEIYLVGRSASGPGMWRWNGGSLAIEASDKGLGGAWGLQFVGVAAVDSDVVYCYTNGSNQIYKGKFGVGWSVNYTLTDSYILGWDKLHVHSESRIVSVVAAINNAGANKYRQFFCVDEVWSMEETAGYAYQNYGLRQCAFDGPASEIRVINAIATGAVNDIWLYRDEEWAYLDGQTGPNNWFSHTYVQELDIVDPVIDSNYPTGSSADPNVNISFSTKDVGGSGVKQSSIDCTIDGEDAIIDGVFQSGWDGAASDITANAYNGYDVIIDKETAFDAFITISVSAYCTDKNGNPATLNWDFDLNGIIVESAEGYDKNTIKVTFNADMQSTIATNANDALNPTNYSVTGGFRKLFPSSVLKVTSKIFHVSVPEMTNNANYNIEVNGTVEDSSGLLTMAESAEVDPAYDEADFTGIGELPRFISIYNPSAGVLNLQFSEELFEDATITRVTSYVVEPMGDAKPLFITGAQIGTAANQVILNFSGGGSVYRLTVNGIVDPAGNYIDPNFNSLLFEVLYPGVDELFDTTNYIFDTNLGAVTMSINTLSKRNIEDLVVQRARNVGHDEQFKLISEALEDAGINRDDQRLKLFKG